MRYIVSRNLLYFPVFSAFIFVSCSAAFGQAADTGQSRPKLIINPGHHDDTDDLPPDFRGEITYEGSIQGTATNPGRYTSWLDDNEVSINFDKFPSIPFKTKLHVKISYNRSNFFGTMTIDGDGRGVRFFTGTRGGIHSSICNIVWTQDSRRISYSCNAALILRDEDYISPQGQYVAIHTEALRTTLVDYAVKERQVAVSQAAVKQRAAPYAAQVSRTATTQRVPARSEPQLVFKNPDSIVIYTDNYTTTITRKRGETLLSHINRIFAKTAYSSPNFVASDWHPADGVFNPDRGSLNQIAPVKAVCRKCVDGGYTAYRSHYTYNGGVPAWFEVIFDPSGLAYAFRASFFGGPSDVGPDGQVPATDFIFSPRADSFSSRNTEILRENRSISNSNGETIEQFKSRCRRTNGTMLFGDCVRGRTPTYGE